MFGAVCAVVIGLFGRFFFGGQQSTEPSILAAARETNRSKFLNALFSLLGYSELFPHRSGFTSLLQFDNEKYGADMCGSPSFVILGSRDWTGFYRLV